jgi:hypothetical protein
MVWGCMLWDGPGFATKIEGRMDAELYTAILEDELQQTMEWYGLETEDVIFQQDNEPKHTSKKARKWFNEHGYQVLQWPAQSPDLNPIEHLWAYVKRKLGAYPTAPKGMLELWECFEKEWNDIPVELCQKVVEGMPKCVRAVYKAKGKYVKY